MSPETKERNPLNQLKKKTTTKLMLIQKIMRTTMKQTPKQKMMSRKKETRIKKKQKMKMKQGMIGMIFKMM